MIYSNEYADYILPYSNENITSIYQGFGAQILDSHYFVVHDRRDNPGFPIKNTNDLFDEYLFMPKLFIPLSTVSLEKAGIIKAQTQPLLNLTGRGTIIGFIDSGIDYTHDAFRTISGESRILALWDQTFYNDSIKTPAEIGTETALQPFEEPSSSLLRMSDEYLSLASVPNPYHYGAIYSKEDINLALRSDNPYSILPSFDETGHGTALAGIACGTPSLENNFTGAAYEAELCVVKLKQAKEYLRQYHFAKEQAVLYQENDIMMGIRFLVDTAQKVNKPLIICLGLGTNQGDHEGNSPISKMISDYSYDTYTIFAIGTGNEGNQSHHYFHNFPDSSMYPFVQDASSSASDVSGNTPSSYINEIEIIVPPSSPGFIAELWGSPNALYSIGFQSPIGTLIAPITAGPGKNDQTSFVLEKTKIQTTFSIVPESGSDQLVYFRFENPIEGNWVIRVYNRTGQNTAFHMWLPAAGILSDDIIFLKPSPDTTLTVPSDAENAISTGFYNAYTNGTVSETGRGFTRTNRIKPNITSPGINVTAPVPNIRSDKPIKGTALNKNPVTNTNSDTFMLQNGYQSFSGSSAASALLAGGIAQLQQWRIDGMVPSIIHSSSMNAYITRGAIRDNSIQYPNPVSGYGKLNIYHVFESLMS